MAAVLARDVHGLAADLERVKVCRENAVLLGGRLVQLLQPLEGLVQQPGAIIELGLSTTLHDFFPVQKQYFMYVYFYNKNNNNKK